MRKLFRCVRLLSILIDGVVYTDGKMTPPTFGPQGANSVRSAREGVNER